jgi:putative membrane protein
MRAQFSNLASFTPVLYALIASPAMADTMSAQEFAQQASTMGQFQISSSQLAIEKSEDARIKKLAQTLLADHNLSINALKAALPSSTVNPNAITADLDIAHQGNLDNLRQTTPKAFDNAFLDIQEDAHENMIDLFKDYAENGTDTTLKNYAQNQLPTLRTHLQTVETLDDLND